MADPHRAPTPRLCVWAPLHALRSIPLAQLPPTLFHKRSHPPPSIFNCLPPPLYIFEITGLQTFAILFKLAVMDF